VHAFCLLGLGVFLARMATGAQQLTQAHYNKILLVTVVFTFAFIVPVGVLFYISYDEQSLKNKVWSEQQHEFTFSKHALNKDNQSFTALLRFADWMLMILIGSEMGKWILIVNILIQFQVYLLIFWLQYLSMSVRDLIGQIKLMKEIEAGYTGFELGLDPTQVNLTTGNYLTWA